MQRMAVLAIVMVVGAAVAVFDLVSGWMAPPGTVAIAAGVGLFGVALAIMGAAIFSAWRERSRIIRVSPDRAAALSRGSNGLRWSTLATVAFAVLLFANCSSLVTTGDNHAQEAATVDPAAFWRLAAWLLLPLLLALALPAVLAVAAVASASSRPRRAHQLGQAALVSTAVIPVAAFATFFPFGVVFGISACDLGNSIGACAAGLGSVANVLSVGSIALLIPYLVLISGGLARAPETPTT